MVMHEGLKMEAAGPSLVSMEQENAKAISLKPALSANSITTHKESPSLSAWRKTLLILLPKDRDVLLNTLWIGIPSIHVPTELKVTN